MSGSSSEKSVSGNFVAQAGNCTSEYNNWLSKLKVFFPIVGLCICLAIFVSAVFAQSELNNSTSSEITPTKAPANWSPKVNPITNFERAVKRGTEDILLIQTGPPWETTSNETVLPTIERSYKKIDMSELQADMINKYQIVLIVSDQAQSFYDLYKNNYSIFYSYVESGGTLLFFACFNGWQEGILNESLPGGVKVNGFNNNKWDLTDDEIIDFKHQIVTGVFSDNISLTNSDLDSSCNQTSFGYFSNLPVNAKTIFAKKGSNGQKPTMVEYKIGKGTVLASLNPWEYFFDKSKSCQANFGQKALDDVFKYAFNIAGGYKTAGINVQIYPEDLWMPKRPELFKAKSDLIDVIACIKNDTNPSQAQSDVTLTLKIDSNLVQSDFLYIYKRSSAEELIVKEPVEVNTSDYTKEIVDGKVVVTLKGLTIKKKEEQLWNDFVFRFKLSDSLQQGALINAEAAVSGDKIVTSSQKLSDGGNITIKDSGNIIITNRELLYKVYAGKEDANGNLTIDKDNAKQINESFWNTLYDIAAQRHAVIYFVDKYDKDGDGDHNNEVKTVKWVDTRENLPYDNDPSTKTDQEESAVNDVVNLIDNMLDGRRDGAFKDNGFISRLRRKLLLGFWTINPQILILGGDKIIPFYRAFDPTETVLDFKGDHNASNVTLKDAENNYTFSDVIFRDTDGKDWGTGGVENVYVGRVTGTTIDNMKSFLLSSNGKNSSSTNVVKVENNMRHGELDEFHDQSENNGYTVFTNIDGVNLDVDCGWWGCNGSTDDLAGWNNVFRKLFTGAVNVPSFDVIRFMVHGDTSGIYDSEGDDAPRHGYEPYFKGNHLTGESIAIKKTFENFYPVFVFDACLVGLVGDEANTTGLDTHLLNALMPLNVRGIYAASGVTYSSSPTISEYNDYFTEVAFQKEESLGKAATVANQKGGDTFFGQKQSSYHSFIMNLFGCPWAKVQTPNDRPKVKRSFMPRDSRIMSTRDGSSTKSITVDCSNYQLNKDTFDIITIEGFKLLRANTSTPVLPMKDFEVNIPLNATVDKVEVIFNGKTDLGKLNIPAYDPPDPMAHTVTGGYVACPTGLGLYPQNQYPYRTVNLTNNKTVILTLFPVTFNTDTQETTLYKNAEIRVTYTTPNAGILDSFATDKDTYGVGESIQTTTSVESISSVSQAFTATVVIEDASGNTVKTQTGSNTIPSNSVDTIPIGLSAPTEQGNYTVRLSVSDGTNVIGESLVFIQVIAGKIVNFQTPSKIDKGNFGTFTINFQNLSANPTDSFNDVYIYNAENEQVAKLPQTISTAVGAGQSKTSTIQWFPSDSLPAGTYRAFVAVTQGKDVFTRSSEQFLIANAIVDNCPNDPNKTEPGLCGCGVVETPGCGANYDLSYYAPPANQPPTADKVYVSTEENKPVSVKLTGSDPDAPNWFMLLVKPVTYSVVTQPLHGTLSGTAPDLTYTPAAGYIGTDSFTFKMSDGTADSAPATVSLVINPVGSMYVDDSLALNISCAEYQGARYGFKLDYSKSSDPSGLYWKMDTSTIRNVGNTGGSCISIGNDLKISVPSALYRGTTYQFSLNYTPISSDASGHYWKMDLGTFKSR